MNEIFIKDMCVYRIREMHPEDFPEMMEIYRQGIESGIATFMTEVPTYEEWDTGHCPECRLVIEEYAEMPDEAVYEPMHLQAQSSEQSAVQERLQLSELDPAQTISQTSSQDSQKSHRILGWFAMSHSYSRPCYKGVVEISIYLHSDCQKKGLGTRLMQAGIQASEEAGFWLLESLVFAENAGSMALHEKCGFHLLSIRKRMGIDAKGNWRDVAFWERRSEKI